MTTLQVSLQEEREGFFRVFPISNCPHVSAVAQEAPIASLGPAMPACDVCGVPSEETWVCLTCGSLGCSRYIAGHAAQHGGDDEGGGACGGACIEPAADCHPIALSLADLSVWCYVCEAYLDVFAIPALASPFSHLHQLKFGEPPTLPSRIGST